MAALSALTSMAYDSKKGVVTLRSGNAFVAGRFRYCEAKAEVDGVVELDDVPFSSDRPAVELNNQQTRQRMEHRRLFDVPQPPSVGDDLYIDVVLAYGVFQCGAYPTAHVNGEAQEGLNRDGGNPLFSRLPPDQVVNQGAPENSQKSPRFRAPAKLWPQNVGFTALSNGFPTFAWRSATRRLVGR